MQISSRCLTLCCLFWIGVAATADAQPWRLYVGWDALNAELGAELATGSGVVVSQVEAPTTGNAYHPDPSNSQFQNPPKNFTDVTGGVSATSNHATSVGRNFYGNTSSIARGITEISIYEANDWLNNATGLMGNANPAPQPFAVQNHSWVASSGFTDGVAQFALMRVDHMINTSNVNVVVGVGNNGTTPRLLAHGLNSLSVGLTNGDHSTGLTRFYFDDRVKPEIVAPRNNGTSFATPMVAGTAAILRDAAQGTNAENNEVVKAMLLAGATKTEFDNWERTSSVPLDTTVGVGELNAYNSYKIFLAGEVDGQTGTPAVAGGPRGWDFGAIVDGQALNYLIQLDQPADQISIALTWNAEIVDLNASETVFIPDVIAPPNLDIFLTGPPGLVDLSTSLEHNIEHIYARDLPVGTYMLSISTDGDTDFGLAWRAALIENSNVDTATVTAGNVAGGTVSDLDQSDDSYLALQPSPKRSAVVPGPLAVELETTSPVNMPNSIQINIEGQANSPNLQQVVEIYDFTAEEFVPVQTSDVATADTLVNAYVTGELMDHIEAGTGRIRVRVSYRPIGAVLQFPWTVRLDEVSWSISQ